MGAGEAVDDPETEAEGEAEGAEEGGGVEAAAERGGGDAGAEEGEYAHTDHVHHDAEGEGVQDGFVDVEVDGVDYP